MSAKPAHTAQWQAAEARHRFSEVIDAAAAGAPQFVHRRDGQEVVVVSREYFERTRPTLKSVLLDWKWEHTDEDGAFEEALREARSVVGRAFMPRESVIKELIGDRPRHGRPQRAAAKK